MNKRGWRFFFFRGEESKVGAKEERQGCRERRKDPQRRLGVSGFCFGYRFNLFFLFLFLPW